MEASWVERISNIKASEGKPEPFLEDEANIMELLGIAETVDMGVIQEEEDEEEEKPCLICD